MKNRKLWKLLTSFDEAELSHLNRWLSAELDDKQQYIQKLLKVLTESWPVPPEARSIWPMLYPNEPYRDDRFRKLIRDLTGWVESFVAIQHFRNHPEEQTLYLIRALRARNLSDTFEKEVFRVEKQLKSRPRKDRDYYRSWYLLEKERMAYLLEHDQPQRILPKGPSPDQWEGLSPLERLNYSAEAWWMHNKLILATQNLTFAQKFGVHIEQGLMPEIIDFIQEHPYLKQAPTLSIYSQLYALLSGQNLQADLQTMLDLIRTEQDQMEQGEPYYFWVLMVNYYIRQLNRSGEKNIARQLFHLYEWGIEGGLLMSEGYLPEGHYKNLISLCLRVKEYEQAWKYLHQFKAALRPDIREEMYRLSLGAYYLAKSAYQDVIKCLIGRKFSQSLLEIQARGMLLQAYYERGNYEIEWLIDQASNLIRFIRYRSQLSDHHQKAFLNRFRLFRRLIKAFTEEELDRLEKAIKKADPVDRPDWLLAKVSDRRNAIYQGVTISASEPHSLSRDE